MKLAGTRRGSGGHRIVATMVLIASVSGMLISCPSAFDLELLRTITDRVEEAALGPQPDIAVFYGNVEILDGGSTDAFIGAVQGTPLQVAFTIKNLGQVPLNLRATSSIVISGANAGLFSVDFPPDSLSLTQGDTVNFSIELNLDAVGTKIALLAIYSDDPDEGIFEFTLSNTALPKIHVVQGAATIENGTGNHSFGEITYGETRDIGFTIKNLGTANLDLGPGALVTVTGEGYVILAQPAASLSPGDETSFSVRLRPPPGSSTGSVSITSNDSVENPFVFTITGTCTLAVSGGSLSGGYGHAVVLKSEGTVWCWGENDHGQLGDAGVADRVYPLEVPGLEGVAAVAAGNSHSLALKDDGTVWAWGYNGYGQLGDGTTVDRRSPVRVAGLTAVSSIAAGEMFSVALKNDGTVWTWGRNEHWQLGDELGTYRSSAGQVAGLSGVIAVSAGSGHAAALKADGTVWTWGWNSDHQLGNATTEDRSEPGQVIGFSGVTALSAGGSSTTALKDDGTVYTWGDNAYGQLGNNSTVDSGVPVLVSGISGIEAVATGGKSAMALGSNGDVYAWGNNAYGQLGDNTLVQKLLPEYITRLSDTHEIACGQLHAMSVDSGGFVWTWGLNASGQLGNGNTTSQSVPVNTLELSGVAAISAGYKYTVARDLDGTVWAWGKNSSGQLGNGTFVDSNIPVKVVGLSYVAQVVAGSLHAVALKDDGTVLAWGDNYYGQLGPLANTISGRNEPISVTGLPSIDAIAAGRMYTLALADDGIIWAWGQNESGQFGNGSKKEANSTPLKVTTISGVAAIAAGSDHTIALRSDGKIWTWGANASGQLGIGTYSLPVASPSLVLDFTTASPVAISAGSAHTVVLMDDGTVWTWGDNTYGQLGDGTLDKKNLPVHVPALSGVCAIATGGSHTLALKTDGTIWGWGNNTNKQLGHSLYDDRYFSPVQVPDFPAAVGLTAGLDHTSAIKGDGTVWSCGYNDYGQLGNGSTSIYSYAYPVMARKPMELF